MALTSSSSQRSENEPRPSCADGLEDLRTEQLTALPQLKVSIDRAATARVGLNVRYAVPAAMVAFLLFGMIVPSVRLRRRTGRTAFVLHRDTNPPQRVIGVRMGAFMVGVLVWGTLLAVLGSERLGVWRPSPPVAGLGWALVVGGLALLMMAQWQMGASWREGLFRVVRNPIQV